MSKPNEPRRRARAVTCAVSIVIGLVVTAESSSAANPILRPNRIGGYYNATVYNNQKIIGVQGTMYVRSNSSSITGTASDINLESTNGRREFVQFGVVQGRVSFSAPLDGGSSTCTDSVSGQVPYYASPHLFLGWWTNPGGLFPDPCETLIDLGQFGVLNSWRSFKLVGHVDAVANYWEAYLDGVLKWSGHIGIDPTSTAMRPQFTAETNDTCAAMYGHASQAASPWSSLLFKTADGALAYWPTQAFYTDTYQTLRYSASNPHGASTSFIWGPTSTPPEC